MITFIILFSLLGAIEIQFKPRFDYLKESSVFVFYYFGAKNKRKRLIFKI